MSTGAQRMSTAGTPRGRPPGWRVAFGLMLFSALVTALYWFTWFVGDRSLIANQQSASYYAFENAFPLADTWLAGTSLLGAHALYRRLDTALLWILLACSSGIYLGLMDVLFNLQNRVYRGDIGSALAVEVGLNVLAFAIPTYGIVFSWRNRLLLLHPEG